MKVLVLAYSFYEYDNRVRRYAESLSKEGHQVDVIALRKIDFPKFVRIKDVNVFQIQRRIVNEKRKFTFIFKMLWFFLKSSFFVTLLHIKNKYELVHVHSIPDIEIFAAWLPRITGAKLILDIHDIVPEFYISKFKLTQNSVMFKILLLIEKFSIAFAHHVIIANQIWYKTLIRRSTTNKKCTVILNYPDPSIFNADLSAKSDDKFILAYTGTLHYHQGLDIAIKAISLIQEQESQIELHIYGLGREKPNLEILAEKLGISDKIHFKGIVPLEKIPHAVSNVHVGVVPKRKDTFGNEAFSTKILEFMAMGIPVIVSDTKIDKYYFNDSLVCFFTSGDEQSLAEKILHLKKNKELRESLIGKGLKHIEEINWEVKKEDYLRIISSLLSR